MNLDGNGAKHANISTATPPINCSFVRLAMYWDVRVVKPLPDLCIYVETEDGRKGVFNMKPYLDHGVFRELRNPHYFNQVGILFGAVTWPNEQDIAPETLIAEMMPPDSPAMRCANGQASGSQSSPSSNQAR